MLKGSILQKLELAHRSGKRPLNFGVYYKNTLIALCHALEDFILECGGQPMMITAFQRGKWYLQEAERYGDIAQVASEVAILASPDTGFAEHPTSQRANVNLVELEPHDPVAQEWHLMIISPQYTAIVLCQELSAQDYGVQGQPKEDRERKFYGFWTFEPELVRETVEIAIAHIGRYNSQLQHHLTTKLHHLINSGWKIEQEALSNVVCKVVDYLQAYENDLSLVTDSVLYQSARDPKALDDNLLSNEMQALLRMAQLIDQADAENPFIASEASALSEAMGQLLDLPAWQIKRLRLAGLLHRLPPLQGFESVLSLEQTPVQQKVIEQEEHLPKSSVLRIMPRLKAITNIITHQHEHWDGSGQPEKLAYDSIPLESRILSLVVQFQQQLNRYKNTHTPEEAFSKALSWCQTQSGSLFDPKLVETLEILVKGLQQGWNLQTVQPKIAAGMWLLEDRETNLINS